MLNFPAQKCAPNRPSSEVQGWQSRGSAQLWGEHQAPGGQALQTTVQELWANHTDLGVKPDIKNALLDTAPSLEAKRKYSYGLVWG